ALSQSLRVKARYRPRVRFAAGSSGASASFASAFLTASGIFGSCGAAGPKRIAAPRTPPIQVMRLIPPRVPPEKQDRAPVPPPSPLLSMPIFLTAFHRSSNFQERRSQGARRGGESADPQIVDAELLHAIALVPLLGGGIGAGHRELQLVRAFPERHLAELLLQKVVRRRVEVKLAG